MKVRTSTGEAVFHIVQPAMLIFSEILKYMWPGADMLRWKTPPDAICEKGDDHPPKR